MKRKRKKRDPEKTLDRKNLREWAKDIKTRAGNICEWCGKNGFRLNAHHIIDKRFKPLRYHRSNGMALCARCHKFWIGLSAHNNPIRVVVWLLANRPQDFEILKNYTEEGLTNEDSSTS